MKRQGLAIANAVKFYGLFVALFGVVLIVMESGWFGHPGNTIGQANFVALGLGALAFFGMGASDEVSAIFRTSMLLKVAPDRIRGRLQGIFTSVVQGGPRLGDVFAGAMTAFIGLWAGPVIGGLAIVAIMFILLRVTPKFRDFKAD